MESEGFLVDLKVAELFFRICKRYGIQAREDRVALMRELARRKKARYLRDVSPLLAGKKVLKVGFKPPHSRGPECYCPDCGPKESK